MEHTRPTRSHGHDLTGGRARDRARRARRGRRVRRTVGVALVATLLTGCGPDANPENNQPGRNVRVNDIAVRYAHLEDPDAPGTGYRVGDDVPLYLWFVNESGEPAQLTDVSSAIAADVTLTEGQTPVELPVGEVLELGPDDPHFVLEDITTQVRGAEFVPITLTFSDGTRLEMMVQAIEIGPLD